MKRRPYARKIKVKSASRRNKMHTIYLNAAGRAIGCSCWGYIRWDHCHHIEDHNAKQRRAA